MLTDSQAGETSGRIDTCPTARWILRRRFKAREGGEFHRRDRKRQHRRRRLYVFHPRREDDASGRRRGVGENRRDRKGRGSTEKERFQWQANSTKRTANGLSLWLNVNCAGNAISTPGTSPLTPFRSSIVVSRPYMRIASPLRSPSGWDFSRRISRNKEEDQSEIATKDCLCVQLIRSTTRNYFIQMRTALTAEKNLSYFI